MFQYQCVQLNTEVRCCGRRTLAVVLPLQYYCLAMSYVHCILGASVDLRMSSPFLVLQLLVIVLIRGYWYLCTN